MTFELKVNNADGWTCMDLYGPASRLRRKHCLLGSSIKTLYLKDDICEEASYWRTHCRRRFNFNSFYAESRLLNKLKEREKYTGPASSIKSTDSGSSPLSTIILIVHYIVLYILNNFDQLVMFLMGFGYVSDVVSYLRTKNDVKC